MRISNKNSKWSLEDALEEFFPDYKRALKKLAKHREEENRFGISPVRHKLSEEISLKSNIEEKYEASKKALIQLIAQERLFAYGMLAPNFSDSKPMRIMPNEISCANIEWDDDFISVNNKEYSDVFIYKNDPQQVSAYPTIEKNEKSTPKKLAGRPSRIGEIIGAYNLLKESGKIDFSASEKQIIRQVSLYMHKNDPDEYPYQKASGTYLYLSDSTMRKALSEKIKADKLKN